jgi:hypothetical protein
MAEVITITLGDVAENHVGMQQIGKMADNGFTLEDLKEIKIALKQQDIRCKIYRLKNPNKNENDAYVLVARQAVDKLLQTYRATMNDMFDEQKLLQFDKKALMRGKVVNKHARWNVCYDTISQKPNYALGKGTVIAYKSIPITQKLIKQIQKYFGKKTKGLKGEGNYYFDISKCGIGFHGDSERVKVIGIRLGASMPLFYQWYYKNERVGDKIKINLDGGDIYVMSEKATGNNWKKQNIHTVRHATGCTKYTK